MPDWILDCPNCGTPNTVLTSAVIVTCGVASCNCTCVNCSKEFKGEQEYWRWLGLVEGPPPARTKSS